METWLGGRRAERSDLRVAGSHQYYNAAADCNMNNVRVGSARFGKLEQHPGLARRTGG